MSFVVGGGGGGGGGANIPLLLQLLSSLQFFASGSFQSVTADLLDNSQASVSRIVCKSPRIIKFPTPSEIPTEKYKVAQIGGLPDVVGTIDCTHVKTVAQADRIPNYTEIENYILL